MPTLQYHPNLDAAPLVCGQARPLLQLNQATKLSVKENLRVAGVSAQDRFLDEVGIDFKCHPLTYQIHLPGTQLIFSPQQPHPTDLCVRFSQTTQLSYL